MNMLMNEGRGECIFEVGLGTDPPPSNGEEADSTAEDAEDASGLNQSDYEASVATLKSVADTLSSDCVLLRERVLSGAGSNGADIPPEAKRTGQYLIRQRADSKVRSTSNVNGNHVSLSLILRISRKFAVLWWAMSMLENLRSWAS